ncbi:MAG TPA: glycosyltransferase family 2 protein, partial [Candidatus Thermoplasmatota archaeon]|nr:glycosyltransferase family 2 protein [Candidatus Thermoplasmatota archaeon]
TPHPPPHADWFSDAGARAARYRDIIARYRHLDAFDVRAAPAPPARVSVLVPTLDEAEYVVDAVRSLALQTLRRDHQQKVELVLVDSGSRDGTRERAAPFVDRIVSAPRGKLSALVAGVRKARGDIVVEADADGWYPPGWLARMVEPFVRPGVVGVRGDFVYYDSPLLRPLSPLRGPLFRALGNFPGGVRAYRREAFLATGGFRLPRDERDFWAVWPEEEFRFRRRLEARGRVVDAPDAVCFKSARRGDPLFVRDPRVDNFRRTLAERGRFSDGVTDALYRARRALRPRLPAGFFSGGTAGMDVYPRR